jgi:hypothetical protein
MLKVKPIESQISRNSQIPKQLTEALSGEQAGVKRVVRKFIVGENISADGRVKNSLAFSKSLGILEALDKEKPGQAYKYERQILKNIKPQA